MEAKASIEDKPFVRQPQSFNHTETFFRLIDPEDYSRHGIDPQDVPMGTFASEDHPGFLPSRFGGNAYGLGLIEQSVLTNADTDFLETVDFSDPKEIGRHVKQLNAIYQKLGLLIRFTAMGKRYFLIPINLVAHSLQEIKAKADEIEEQIVRHMWESRTERLDIGLLTAGDDLMVHELTARLSSHRIVLFESLEKLRSWRTSVDIFVIPKDIFEYLLEQKLPSITKRPLSRQHLFQYAMYLAGKLYDLLEENGRLLVLAHSPIPREDQVCRVRFKSEEDLKSFLLFSHIFNTKKTYEGSEPADTMEIHLSDLHYYLGRFAFSEPHLRQLLGHHKPEELTVEEINMLPRLNLRLPQTYIKSPEKPWRWLFEPYFTTHQLMRKSPRHHHQYWRERLEIDRDLPESLLIYTGQPRKPEVDLVSLDDETRMSGMLGCSLSLVADYRNSFRYVVDVLNTLIQIRDRNFPKLSELERTRLSNPFRNRNESFTAVTRLVAQVSKLEKIRDLLNPDYVEGLNTPILENIPKLSLHGFSPAQLREILLIVAGHSTMSRIVLGKLPAKTLKPITDRAKEGDYQEILDLLRACRIMSMAEIAAALGDAFTGEQAKELYRLYDDAISVATDTALDWEKLNDLRISALGGVQNKALREMMKLFNIFEFLDDWQELIHKGPLEKEVICDYKAEKLHHLEEALELSRISSWFKEQFMGDYIFGQSYFFRQALDTEFHGTGHLFPRLGTRAGFILLWIAVNSSERHIVNFNPMLAGIPRDREGQRIQKIRESLLRVSVEMLQPGFFEEIKKRLSEGRPAFIFDSGIRLVTNTKTWALDVSFVDVDEDIQQIEILISHLESQRLGAISLKTLQEIERLFSELRSFHTYLQKDGCDGQCDCLGGPEELQIKDSEIGKVESRLKAILQNQIFIPEEIYDSISALAAYCPEILRFILPELHTFGTLFESWPGSRRESVGMYVMRCLEKFQALINKDRNAFQDRNTFYQLAKQEFGPLAEEGIGASHAQLDILEYVVDRIQQRPIYYQALTLALLFQDIGKVEQYTEAFPDLKDCWTHAERGALVLERTDILDKYHLDAQVKQLVVSLVRCHGIDGHVLRGEEPITALDRLTSDQDDRLLDVLVLHAVLAASAVQENLMVSDLLDGFLAHRAMAIQVLKSNVDWQTRLREVFREKGQAVLADFQLTSQEAQVFPSDRAPHCGFVDSDIRDDALWHGRQTAALERLLKLMGIVWVDYQDLQMHLLKMPVNFIYHKKKLKSIGLASFEKDLRAALKLWYSVSLLSSEVRFYLLYCLDHLGGALRIYGFHPLAKSLEMDECLKLLLISFQAFHHHFGEGARGGTICFRPLSRQIERKCEAIQNLLQDHPFPDYCSGADAPPILRQGLGGLHFEVNSREPGIRLEFQDAVQFDRMLQALGEQWSHADLDSRCQELLDELRQKAPYDADSFAEELLSKYREQERKINDRILRAFQERLSQVLTFTELQEVQEEIEAKHSEVNLSEEQQFLLREMFEFHRARLRDRYLESIYQEVNGIESRELISSYWNTLKHDLYAYRAYIGKEYESLIAQFIDQKLENAV